MEAEAGRLVALERRQARTPEQRVTFMMMLQGTCAFEMFMSGSASGSSVLMLQSVMTPLSSRLWVAGVSACAVQDSKSQEGARNSGEQRGKEG